MHGLTSASTWIRRQVSDKVRFRRMPKYTFKIDQQLFRQQEVLASIAEAKQEDDKRAQKKEEG